MAKLPRPPRVPQHVRETLERKRQFEDSPLMREVARAVHRLRDMVVPPPEPAAKAKPAKRKRKPGAGRKSSLSDEDRELLQARYRSELGKNPKLRVYTLAGKRLSKVMPNETHGVSLSTLKRDVFWPVLGKRAGHSK